MTDKKYDQLEKVTIITIYTILACFVAALLLGVYALADLVL